MDATGEILGLPKITQEKGQTNTHTTPTMVKIKPFSGATTIPKPYVIPLLSQVILNVSPSPKSTSPTLEQSSSIPSETIDELQTTIPSNELTDQPLIENIEDNPKNIEVEMNQKEDALDVVEPPQDQLTPVYPPSPNTVMQEQEQNHTPSVTVVKHKKKKKVSKGKEKVSKGKE